MPSEEAAPGSRSSPVSRRAVLGGLSLLPLAAAMRGTLPAASADTGYRFLTPHQAAVLDAATRRPIPGPQDCPVELGPGAHEANVVNYLDRMLSVFDVRRPGDTQPRGYTAAEVEAAQWDLVVVSDIINRLRRGGWEQVISKLGGRGGVSAG
ncbi:hypothetical protein [Mycobacterium sp.]|uniref:hypothetical protein n=1 Tax=Mycobacterium sp. TaxID=1785 RepID=UPI002613552B|nr:hypothetical protein [Mycobacterium sp.]